MPEYCKVLEESDILENSFQLLFAFDEIVALGYRETVNLAQIRTFIEMDSHEERVINAVRNVGLHLNCIYLYVIFIIYIYLLSRNPRINKWVVFEPQFTPVPIRLKSQNLILVKFGKNCLSLKEEVLDT